MLAIWYIIIHRPERKEAEICSGRRKLAGGKTVSWANFGEEAAA